MHVIGWSSIKLKGKLILSFSLMVILMVIIGITGYVSTKNVHAKLAAIFQQQLPSIDFLVEADRDLFQMLTAERSMIFTNTKSDQFAVLMEEYTTNRDQAKERFDKYARLATTDDLESAVKDLKLWIAGSVGVLAAFLTAIKYFG